MRTTLLALTLLILSPSLFSQDSLLKKFKFRTKHYRAIALSFGGGGLYDKIGFVSGKYENHAAGASLGAGYTTLKSTDHNYLVVTGSISSAFSLNNVESTTTDNKTQGYFLTPQLHVSNKWFSRKLYFELGADLHFNNQQSKATSDNPPYLYKDRQTDYLFLVNIGMGKGRVENVTDMQNALWLHDALKKENKFSRPLSEDDLYELGRAITAANTTRILDSRRNIQFILETIDNYFQQKGLLAATDIRYFSNLNDVLFFAINEQRLSGKEKYIRLTPAVLNLDAATSQEPPPEKYEDKALTKSATLSIGFNKFIPVSLRHQNNYGFEGQLNYFTHDYTNEFFSGGVLTSSTAFDSDLKQAGINMFFQHEIYPNTRTIVRFDISTQMGYEELKGDPYFYGAVNLSGTANYFVSYKTRLFCSLQTVYQRNVINIYNYYLTLFPDNLQLLASAGIQINL